MRSLALFLCLGVELSAQRTGQDPLGSSYKDLRPEQKRLVDELTARFNKQTGQKIEPSRAFDTAPQSIRTTFDAVTHALLTTKLTDPGGKQFGTGLDIIDAVEEIAGERVGESGDRQFRVYFFLKPNARTWLDRSREFDRDRDNTVFHHGYPICYRMPGTPSVQVSISADGKRADVDVDYRSSRFPKGLVNGHLTASNSDVRAGKNDRTHNGRWNGLVAWWTDLFSLGGDSSPKQEAKDEGAAYNEVPRKAKGKIEDAVQDFYQAWLAERSLGLAVPYFSRQSFGCIEQSARTRKVTLQRGMARVYLAKRLESFSSAFPPSKSLSEYMTAIPPWTDSLKLMPHPDQKNFLLARVGPEFADAHDCAKLADPTETSVHRKGEYYVSASRLKTGKTAVSDILLLWSKEGGVWKIIAYDVIENDKHVVFSKTTSGPKPEPVKIIEVEGDPELVKSVGAFFTDWLVKRRASLAVNNWMLPEAFACAAEDDPTLAKRGAQALKRRMVKGMDDLADELGKGNLHDALEAPRITHHGLRVVKHSDSQHVLILSVPDGADGWLTCGKRITDEEIEKVLAKTSTYGKIYMAAASFEEVDGEPGVLFTAWRRTPQGWRVFWWEVETP